MCIRETYLLELTLNTALFLSTVAEVRGIAKTRFNGFLKVISAKSLIDLIASFQFACENSRFSSLFAAEDVSRGITSATQRQKFHSGDVKSVRNPVRSADWSTEYLHCFSFCLRMTDKRQKATKVKCKRDEAPTKQSKLVEYILL